MWLIKFMERSVIKGYDILLTGDRETLSDNKGKTRDNRIMDALNLLNKTAYKITLTKEDTLCFQIIEESKTKENKYGDTR